MIPAPRRSALLLAAIAASAPVCAAVLNDLDITRDSARYELTADVMMDAPAEAIFQVLTDYDRFDRISSIYKESGYLDPAEDGTPLVYTRVEGCLLFYCMNMRRVERLETRWPQWIRTTALPEHSDFHFSQSEWLLVPEGGGTRVSYRLEMEPDFRVPPVIGPWVLKRRLLSGGARAVERIEKLAQELHAEANGAI
jgi:hypothetical protein